MRERKDVMVWSIQGGGNLNSSPSRAPQINKGSVCLFVTWDLKNILLIELRPFSFQKTMGISILLFLKCVNLPNYFYSYALFLVCLYLSVLELCYFVRNALHMGLTVHIMIF